MKTERANILSVFGTCPELHVGIILSARHNLSGPDGDFDNWWPEGKEQR